MKKPSGTLGFGTEKEKAFFLLMLAAGRAEQAYQTALRNHGMSFQQYRVLRVLANLYPGSVSVAGLQEWMTDASSNVSRLVEKLRQQGLVSRRENDTDRRLVDISITSEGRDKLWQIEKQFPDRKSFPLRIKEKDAIVLSEMLETMLKEEAG